METVTEALESSVDHEANMKAHETAVKLLIMRKLVLIRATRCLQESKREWVASWKKDYYLSQHIIAQAQSKRLLKMYKQLLFNMFRKVK